MAFSALIEFEDQIYNAFAKQHPLVDDTPMRNNAVVTVFHFRMATKIIQNGNNSHYSQSGGRTCVSLVPDILLADNDERWIEVDVPYRAMEILSAAAQEVKGHLDLSDVGQQRIRDEFDGNSFANVANHYFQSNKPDYFPKPPARTWREKLGSWIMGSSPSYDTLS